MRRITMFFLLFSLQPTFSQQTYPINGVHDEKHICYGFTHARIFVDYKTVIDSATLLIKDGIIVNIGKNIKFPVGTVIYDIKGKTIYPSLIDLYSNYGMPEAKKMSTDGSPQMISNTKGAYSWNQAIKPEVHANRLFVADTKKADEMRKLGFGAVLTHNTDGIARGTGVFVALGDEKENKLVLRDKASAHFSFEKGSSNQDYPSSQMGSIALIRQTYLDAQWYQDNYEKGNACKELMEYNISLDAWNSNTKLPQIFESSDKLTALRADKVGDEFGVSYIIKGSGDEYQRINEIKATKDTFIIPLNFPLAYDMEDPYDALQINLAELKHWEMAPGNPAALEKANIPFAFTTADLKDKSVFWKNLRKALDNGLSEQEALKALTFTPAELIRMQDKVGAIKKGMYANFIITSRNLFDKNNIIYENWVLGKQYKINDMDFKDIRGTYDLKINSLNPMKLFITGEINDISGTIEMDSGKTDTSKIKSYISRDKDMVTIQFELKKTVLKGQYRLSGYVEENTIKGQGQLPNGNWISWTATQIWPYLLDKKDSTKKEIISPGVLTYPNKAYGWKEIPVAKPTLIKNVTLWTNEKEGILKNTDILIADGKIIDIANHMDYPTALHFSGSKTDSLAYYVDGKKKYTIDIIIDGTGKHLTPGIVDEHSHIAISRGVNEGAQSVTSEVRIGDVVNCDDINIYRDLAGGVTTAQLLHGSANPIGGQSQLIKLRWGLAPEQLKFVGADGFIKFALGENVKQSNWGDKQTVRFPQTRMGVEQTYIDAFTRAKEYETEWTKYNALNSKEKNTTPSPRKDLELDALVEILNKKRFITCHSYVQSEINMLMHVADSMGFTVNTFTHILEGYKVADKMKVHGAGASTFADWWAYKYEVMEAIPYNAAILHNMGIITAVNSDDPEMARRLNQEAAKAIKYGNLSEEEALKLCTLNPAKLLHVDSQVGSIKRGKDADLVLWTDNPLSIYAKVDKTFIDGIPYYDSEKDQAISEDIKNERNRIIQKMIDTKKKGEKTQKATKLVEDEYNCETLREH